MIARKKPTSDNSKATQPTTTSMMQKKLLESRQSIDFAGINNLWDVSEISASLCVYLEKKEKIMRLNHLTQNELQRLNKLDELLNLVYCPKNEEFLISAIITSDGDTQDLDTSIPHYYKNTLVREIAYHAEKWAKLDDGLLFHIVLNMANKFVCPITNEVFIDPVVVKDGNTYERRVCSSEELYPNKVVKAILNHKILGKLIRDQIIVDSNQPTALKHEVVVNMFTSAAYTQPTTNSSDQFANDDSDNDITFSF